MKDSVPRAYIGPRRSRQFASLGLLLGLAACAIPRAGAQPVIEVRTDTAYGPLPMEVGDLYIPADPRGPKPAVVIIHGGGWVEGSRQFDGDLSRFIASHGAVVFNIDYRLANKAQPGTRWPAQLVDAQLAVRYLRAHAVELGIDTSRLGAVGDSAGAQLAVFLGVLPRTVPGDMAALFPDSSPSVKAVVDQFGPMDLPGMGLFGTGSIDALFGTPNVSGTELLTTSPIPSIGGRSAPVYIIHGEADQVVPFQQSRQLADTLRAHGVTAELVPYAGKHGYEGVSTEDIIRLQSNAVKWLLARLQ